MAVGDYNVQPFTLPVGADPVAWQARSNDNLLRAKFVAHQADEVAHVQSGLASAKPVSGTATGEVYIATDTGQMWIWSGTAWQTYSAGGGGVSDGDKGDITVSGSGTVWTIDNGVVSTAKMGGDVTTAGKALLDDADASAQRTTLGLGTLATQNGTFSGTSSGTNTGDVTLTGTPTYITIAGQTITRNQVNLASEVSGDLPFANLTPATAASKLLGRGSASGAGDFQEISLGTSLTMSGTTLSTTNPGLTDGDKGDITVSASGATWTIDNSAVTYAKMQNVSATDKVLGRSTAGAGVVEEIACTAAGRAILDDADAAAQRTTLGLGTLATQSGTFSGTSSGTNTGDVTLNGTPTYLTIAGQTITRNLVDLASHVTGDLPFANLTPATAASKLLGRGSAAGAGDFQEITLGTNLSMSGTTLNATGGAGSGDVVGDDTATTIQNIVAYSTTGGKNITELTGTQGDILYHNGTSWAKLGAGTLGQILQTNGTGANPSWVNDTGYTYIIKSANQDVTNAGLTADTELTFAVAANNRYMLTMELVIAGNNTTGDFTMDFSLSTGTMKGRGNVQNLTAAEAIQNVIITAAGTANTTAIVTGTPADLDTLIAIRIQYAFLYTSGSNGTLTFRFGNAAAAAGRTSRVYKGSILGYKNIT